ncbi:MAG: M48 family metallopeptidase [Candidatus Omnitrophica bacterium]|nr:M48 family metallopeptidase [Candidatus Omnitrophota bacterium]
MQNSKYKIKKLVTGYCWMLATGFLSGCATVYNPATEQRELILIDTNTEILLGRQIDFQVSQNYRILRGSEENERVNLIGRKIAEVSDRQDVKYIFKIIKDKEVNAFCLPGGYVYIHTGLLEKVNDEELACVIGHEVGHIAARHIVKKIQAQLGYELLVSLALGKGGAKDIERALNITFNIIALGYSREDEFLADKLGIKYAYRAGYNPEAMISLFKKLQEFKKDREIATPLFLRSHPYLEQRIERAGEEIAKIKGRVQQSSQDSFPYSADLYPKDNKQQITGFGLYKICPQCGKRYPRTYGYCPEDGSKLH